MKKKFIAVAVLGAVISFTLSRVLWPDLPGIEMPGPELIPYFIIVSIFESLALGIGVAFLFLGYPLVSKAVTNRWQAWWTFAAIVWSLVSWWPHDNLHRVNAHDNFVGLLRLEYGFHITLIMASCIMASFFYQQLRKVSSSV